MVIFHSYVSLPEGTYRYTLIYPLIQPIVIAVTNQLDSNFAIERGPYIVGAWNYDVELHLQGLESIAKIGFPQVPFFTR